MQIPASGSANGQKCAALGQTPDLGSPWWVSSWNVTVIAVSLVVRLFLPSFIVCPHPCPSFLRTTSSPHCPHPAPSTPSQAPCRPLTRTLCLYAKWTAFLTVDAYSDCISGLMDGPVLVLWTG